MDQEYKEDEVFKIIGRMKANEIKKKEPINMLQDIFVEQSKLNARIGAFGINWLENGTADIASLSEEQRNEALRRFITEIWLETAELQEDISHKWWKNQSSDIEHAREEAIDILHFLVSVMQLLGMSAEDVYNVYMKKSQVNHDRQAAQGN